MKVEFELNLSDKIVESIKDMYFGLVETGVSFEEIVMDICNYLVDDSDNRFDDILNKYRFNVHPSGMVNGRVINEEMDAILSNHTFSDKQLVINILTMSFLELNFYRESQGIVPTGDRTIQMKRFMSDDYDVIGMFYEDDSYRKNVVSDALFYMFYSSDIYNYNVFKTLFNSSIGDVIYNIFPSFKDRIDPRVEDYMCNPPDITLFCKYLEIEQNEIERIMIREGFYPNLSDSYFRFRNNLLNDSLLQSIIWNKYNDSLDIKPDVFSENKLVILEMLSNILLSKRDDGILLSSIEDSLLRDIELNNNSYEDLFNYYDSCSDKIGVCLANNFSISNMSLAMKRNDMFSNVRKSILSYYKERNCQY